MTKTALNEDWEEKQGKLKQQFALLTDNDFIFTEGKKEEMLSRIQTKLGISKEELQRILSAL
jgi:uncharacterized protein YjbJ (UPF0337 family)